MASSEHRVGMFAANQVPDLNLPGGYKQAVTAWYKQTSDPPTAASGEHG